jgi:hypothetical protein
LNWFAAFRTGFDSRQKFLGRVRHGTFANFGTGHFLPPRVVTNFDIMEMMETTDEFIVKRTGIERRFHAEPGVCASDLAVPACCAAVQESGLTMDQIDLLIVNTITPDHADPGCAFFLQPKLGLRNIPVLDIKQQCAGLLYALSIADQGIATGAYRHVLIACTEVLSTRIDGSYDGATLLSCSATVPALLWWDPPMMHLAEFSPPSCTPMAAAPESFTPRRLVAHCHASSIWSRKISTRGEFTSA